MSRPLLFHLAAVLLLGGSATGVLAGATSPTLVLSAATGIEGDDRRAVAVDGTFDHPNAVQVGYPLELVVFQGTRFVRFPVAGTPATGTSALLADGRLDDADVAGVLAAGANTPPEVRVVSLTGTRIVVSLPAGFTAGATTAILVAPLAEGTVLSNPLALVLP